MKRRGSDEARTARASEHAARREHRRAVNERLAELRAKLREAIQAKKARMKEIVRVCRAERHAVRGQLRTMRAQALEEIAERARGARAAAKAECAERKADARKTYQSAVDIVRAEVAAERLRQVEERRINREERARHAAARKAHASGARHRAVRAPMVEALAPLHPKAKPAPGESRAEAVLKYAEAHPEQAHAALEPAAVRAIEATQAQIIALARTAETPTAYDLERAGRAAKRRAKTADKPATYVPLAKKPRKGQRLRFRDESGAVMDPTAPDFTVTSVRDDGIAWIKRPGEDATSFIYRHANGSFNRRAEVRETASRRASGAERAKVSAPREENALREAITRAVEVMRKADKKRQQLTESFERGRYGKRTRAEMYDAVAAADREVGAKSALATAAETTFREVTGRDHWGEPAPSQATASPTGLPNAYEQKRAARVERMRSRASKLKAEAEGAHKRAHSIASMIPLGQPILVGHHSEKRHRRDIARIDQGFRKSFELTREAEALARRADFAEKNRAISSDDPSAIGKLRAKLAELNASRTRWKLVNQAVRAARNEGDLRASLARLGMNENDAPHLLAPDFAGRVGIADYRFKNAGAEARRLEQRIKQLEKAEAAPEKPAEAIGSARIYEAENRVRVEFPAIPPEAVRKKLKGAGFRWSPTVGAWQRHASNGAWFDARQIAAATT